MSSSLQPKVLSYLAGGTIVKGHAVKFGADNKHVVECTAGTDKVIGIAQEDATSGQYLSVALPGGGAKAVAHGTIALGDSLGSFTDGTLQADTTIGDQIIGIAMDAAAAGDVFAVHVVRYKMS